MVLDHRLVAAGDEDEMLDAGLARLVDHVLDQRPVDDGQHLLRHRLGGRQETRAETGDGKNSLADLRHRSLRAARRRRGGSSGSTLITGKPYLVPYGPATTGWFLTDAQPPSCRRGAAGAPARCGRGAGAG